MGPGTVVNQGERERERQKGLGQSGRREVFFLSVTYVIRVCEHIEFITEVFPLW